MDHDTADTYAPDPGSEFDDQWPPYVPPAAPTRRYSGRMVALAAGIVALLAAGAFAVVSITGDDGAGSPEDAVHQLLDAGSHEDLIGVLEALPPGERSAILDPVKDIASELKRLGIVDDGLDLSSVGGLDLDFRDVTMTSRALADGIAEVTITGGTATARSIPDDIPIGPELDKILDGWGASAHFDPVTSTEDMAGVRLVAIKEGGGWHVSLFYSIAEQGRRDSDSPLPPFGHGVVARGADSPEGAVREALQAATQLDVRRLVELTPPDEMRALHDYAPLFLDDIERWRAEHGSEFQMTIDDLTTDVTGSGDVRHVAPKTFKVSVVNDGETATFAWDGHCVDAASPGEDPRHECVGDTSGAFGDLKVPQDAGITVVQRDGDWYVSPTRTVFDLLVSALRAVDKGSLEKLADPEGLFGSLFGTSSSEKFTEVGNTIGEGDPSTATTVPALAEFEARVDGCRQELAANGQDPAEDPEAMNACMLRR